MALASALWDSQFGLEKPVQKVTVLDCAQMDSPGHIEL